MGFEQIGVSTVIEGLSTFKSGANEFNRAMDGMSGTVKDAGLTWTSFLRDNLGPAMKETGSFTVAIKQLAGEWNTYKSSLQSASSETRTATAAIQNSINPLQDLSRSLLDIGKHSLSGLSSSVRSFASGIASISVGALDTIWRSLGNIAQIAAGIVTTQVLFRVADAFGNIARQAFEAAANFQTLQIQIQGLIALQIADQFAANNMVSQSFGTLITLTADETAKLQDLTLESSDLHSQMELLERKIPQLIEQFGASSAEVNLAQNQLTRYGIALGETDAQIAALNEKNGAYVTVTKLVNGATLDMATAQSQAAEPARQLLQWIEDFGIKTPFTIQQLSEMVRGFLSIGMGIEPTKQLTNALASLGAGLGLTQAQLDRIVQNILQTSRSAKITERDIREFGNAGVPVNRVLDKMAAKLGITREAALEFAKSGVEGTKAFTDAIIEVGEKDFPDALDNLSRTWAVAASNIQDVIQSIFGKEVLGPLLARLGIFISETIDKVLSMREVFKNIGETIGKAFDSISPSVGALLSSVSGLVTALLALAGIDLSKFDINTAITAAAAVVTTFLDNLTDVSDWFQTEIIPKAETVKQWFIDNWPKAQEKIDAFKAALDLIKGWFEREALPPLQTFATNAVAELGKINAWIIGTGIPKVKEFIAAFNFGENLKTAEGNPFEALSLSITGFIQKLSTDVPTIGVFLAAVITAGTVLQAVWSAIVETLTPSVEKLLLIFQDAAPIIGGVFEKMGTIVLVALAAIAALLVFFAGVITGVLGGIATAIEFASTPWQIFMDNITVVINGIIGLVTGMVETVRLLLVGDLGGALTQIGENFFNLLLIVTGAVGAILAAIGTTFALIIGLVVGFVRDFIGFFQNLYDELVGHSIVPDMMRDILKAILEGWTKITTAFGTAITDTLTGLKDRIKEFVDLGKDFAAGIAIGVTLLATQIADAAVRAVKDAIDAAGKALEIQSPSKVTARLVGQPFGEGIAQGILSSVGAIEAATAVAVQPPVAAPAAAFASGTIINQTNTVNADVKDGVDIQLLALQVSAVMQGTPVSG